MVSRSRWFVGSSSSSTSAGRHELARQTQDVRVRRRSVARPVSFARAPDRSQGHEARRRRAGRSCSRPRARSARDPSRICSSAASLESCSRFAACSTSERSRASRSANCPAAASQTVVASAKLAMLLEQRDAEVRAVARSGRAWAAFRRSRDETASSCPCRFGRRCPIARPRDGERDVLKQHRRAELHDERPKPRICVTWSSRSSSLVRRDRSVNALPFRTSGMRSSTARRRASRANAHRESAHASDPAPDIALSRDR